MKDAALTALGNMQPGEVPSSLRDAMAESDPDARGRAVEALVAIGGDPAAELLVGALADADAAVRQAAGRGLWDIAADGRAQALLPYLKSPDPKVRCAIAGVLGKVRALECAGLLAEAAADPDPHVRASVVNAFRILGEEAAYYLDAVAARAGDTDPFVRARALEALAAMAPTSADAARHHVLLMGDKDPDVRRAAAACLLSYAKRDIHEPLVDLLSDPARRPQALEALHAADEPVLRKLLTALQDRPAAAASAAADTLSYVLSSRWTADDFRPDLDSLDPKTRLAGVEGLALVGSPEAVAELCRILKADPDSDIRCRTAAILAQFAVPAAQEAARTAAQHDPDPRVRQAASAALGGIPPTGPGA